ncbi:MAG: hypothetical protein PHY46_01645, partial [Candidatus Omnitrophica bacterium]|nr:hypothetical protein [Candidatus Omnitrophota bacterium]
INRRFKVIKELTDALALKFKKRFLNHSLDVLLEDKKDGLWRGYSQNYLLTYLKNDDNLNIGNKIVNVKITKITPLSLCAKLSRR